jgi:two-component system, cell cycle response regulator DivK
MAKIVVVEDNPANMKLAVFLLEKAGHQVLQVRDAEAALLLVEQEQPTLVLMDIHLPGMDGLTATRRLKGNPATQAVKVLALTGFAMKGDEERMLAAGCDGYVAKPISYDIFMAAVAQVLA